jgi:ferredoxin-NADP reductase
VAPGRLDVDAIATAQAEPRRCRFYLSGPKAMIVAFRDRLLQSHGLAADRVVIDAWD